MYVESIISSRNVMQIKKLDFQICVKNILILKIFFYFTITSNFLIDMLIVIDDYLFIHLNSNGS